MICHVNVYHIKRRLNREEEPAAGGSKGNGWLDVTLAIYRVSGYHSVRGLTQGGGGGRKGSGRHDARP